jgi:predicted ATPase
MNFDEQISYVEKRLTKINFFIGASGTGKSSLISSVFEEERKYGIDFFITPCEIHEIYSHGDRPPTGLSYISEINKRFDELKPGNRVELEHPDMLLDAELQIKLGEMIVSTSNKGVQLFIETHSELVVDIVRVEIRNKNISPDDVVCFFLSQNIETNSIDIHEIRIDNDGKFYKKLRDGNKGKVPKGFHDAKVNLMMKLF